MTSDTHGTPEKGRVNDQASVVNDPSKVDTSANMDPDDLRVSPREMFIQATEQTRMAICISDPQLPDCPIIYCNQAFSDLTGYDRNEVVGRNCRFLQGDETDPDSVARLRKAVENREFTAVKLLNYRKDGSAFWNAVHVGPIFNKDGGLEYFYGSQWNITELLSEREKSLAQERVSNELRHRTDNLFGVINAMVRMSAKKEDDVGQFAEKVTNRISALANAHRVSIPATPDMEGTPLQTLVEAVLTPYRNRNLDRVHIGGEAVVLAPKSVTALGLCLHELATNAVKYGALGTSDGTVSVTWRAEEGTLLIEWLETMPALSDPDRPDVSDSGGGAGTLLMTGMLQSVQGSIASEMVNDGYAARISLPLGQTASQAPS